MFAVRHSGMNGARAKLALPLGGAASGSTDVARSAPATFAARLNAN
jgi:hypothetical protein